MHEKSSKTEVSSPCECSKEKIAGEEGCSPRQQGPCQVISKYVSQKFPWATNGF
jgi:hypothetical protein